MRLHALDNRLQTLRRWIGRQATRFELAPDSLRPASNDASFRRYFRVDTGLDAGTLIVMDAPPEHEDCRPFVHAARVLAAAGVSVPEVLHADLASGFLLLSDFGHTTYLSVLDTGDPDAAQPLYRDAIAALVRMQVHRGQRLLAPYDRGLLRRELDLYPDWYLARHKGVELRPSERDTIEAAFELLLANNLAQPRVIVHRDYHSRNLMVLNGARNPGLLDFQDAVHGPITYDLVSLLRDAYLRWPEAQGIDWAARYWEQARAAGLPVEADFGRFYRDFEWMGLQRHLKVLGIFARLNYRDGKPAYLADLPRVLGWVLEVTERYDALRPLRKLVDRIEALPARAPGAG
ncbi:MAG: phosphotransferase [Burkholderiales bacterium]|nr:MAG: phosphotransferase [Burkholderiales bacterium]